MQKPSTSSISAFMTTLIAVTAVVISVGEGIETRRHNRLSVKPVLSVFKNGSTSDQDIGLYLENNGTGPARIISIDIVVKKILSILKILRHGGR